MKNCYKCGNELFDEAVICPQCGCQQENYMIATCKDSGNILWYVLSFFVFWAGIILFFVWKDTAPKKAKLCLSGAMTQLALGVVAIIYVLFR